MNSKEKKVVVLVGAGGLIGRAIVRGLVASDMLVVAADVNSAALKSLLDENKVDLHNIDCESLDITSQQAIEKVIASVMEKRGRIDALVNCAYPRNKKWGAKLEDVTYHDFCENVNMHLGGCFLLTQQFANSFKKTGSGNVINFSSIYGVMAPRFEIYDQTPMTMPVEYAAIKSAIIHMMRYFAQYHKGSGIRFNCISPGGILSNQPEQFLEAYASYCAQKGMLDAQDLVGAVKFLLSEDSRYINGQNIIVDDGFSI